MWPRTIYKAGTRELMIQFDTLTVSDSFLFKSECQTGHCFPPRYGILQSTKSEDQDTSCQLIDNCCNNIFYFKSKSLKTMLTVTRIFELNQFIIFFCAFAWKLRQLYNCYNLVALLKINGYLKHTMLNIEGKNILNQQRN